MSIAGIAARMEALAEEEGSRAEAAKLIVEAMHEIRASLVSDWAKPELERLIRAYERLQ